MNKLQWKKDYDKRTGKLIRAEALYNINSIRFTTWYHCTHDYIRVWASLYSKSYNKWVKIDEFDLKEMEDEDIILSFHNWIENFRKEIA